jgi:phosphoribosylformylglycinamidine cyclo-ligase
VNHCTNDILAVGARPLFFLDYFAAGKLDVDVFEEVVSGLAKACKENDCALIGGETAEMPDFYKPGDYDISGTIIGVAEKGELMPNRGVNTGDILVGLPSTGLHTNGYSLARKVLLDHYNCSDFVESLGSTIGDALLAIHKSYLPAMDGILHENWLVGISHITGGGIVDNTKRILGENQNLEIDWSCWERPPIFKLIQELGNVPEDDMRHSMNLGIGLIIVVKPEGLSALQTHLASQGEPYIQLGTVI